MKFEVGDKVRIKDTKFDGEGVITYIDNNNLDSGFMGIEAYRVKAKFIGLNGSGIDEIFFPSKNLELLEEEIKPHTTAEKHKAITDELQTIYVSKNKDYGDAFGISMKEHGTIAAVVRIGDKYNRLKALIDTPPQVKDESLEDTLMDMANYCIMTVMSLREQNNGDNLSGLLRSRTLSVNQRLFYQRWYANICTRADGSRRQKLVLRYY